MTMENNNMDKFLRGSLDNLEVQPTRNVWKSISKRLLIFEIVRLNFTHVGKFWLYSGLATITTLVGLGVYNLDSNTPQESSQNLIETTINSTSDFTEKTDKTDNTSTELLGLLDQENEAVVDINTEPNKQTELLSENNSTQISELNTEKTSSILSKSQVGAELNEAKKENIKEVSSQETNNLIAQSNATPHNSSGKEIILEEIVGTNSSYREEIEPLLTTAISSSILHTQSEIASSIPKLSKTKSLRPAKFDYSTLENDNEDNQAKTSKSLKDGRSFYVSANYGHDWPLANTDYLPEANMYSIQAGLNWNKWEFGLGIGMQSDKTSAEYEFLYSTFDSVGFYYDIDYYETIPGNPDSIIIHYTVKTLSDTVAHSNTEERMQDSRWVVIPIEIGYELINKKNYILKVDISARFGWEYYRETYVPSSFPYAINASHHKIGSESVSPFIITGLGFENQIRIIDRLWFSIEPQMYYYVKTPYKWNGSKASGPFGFGINTGIKFKF